MARQYITDSVVQMPDTGFVLAIKNDTKFVARNLASDLVPQERIEAAYNRFCEGLNAAFEKAFGEDFELHIFSDMYVEAQQKTKAQGYAAVSLDPCIGGKDAFSLGVSRHFREGGLELIGLDARPGFPPLADQISALKDYAAGRPVALIEDDIFSGFTMFQTVEKLRSAGIDVRVIIPGIQIGGLSALDDGVLRVDAVHKYAGTPAQMKNIDLTDYRDFLFGADGLVIQHDHGEKSRIPFIKPFTSPHARISVPKESEDLLSREVWQLNAAFFDDVALKVGDMNPHSMKALRGIWDPDALMHDLISKYL